VDTSGARILNLKISLYFAVFGDKHILSIFCSLYIYNLSMGFILEIQSLSENQLQSLLKEWIN